MRRARQAPLLLAAVLALPAPLLAQTAAISPQAEGIIKGTVIDGESGEPLPYTNIFVAGTNIGTMAFTDGYFIIRGLPPGSYTVRASYISYRVESESVTIGAGEVAHIEFRLMVQAIMMDPFDIEAERRLIEVERTGSSHYISSRQMDAMPLDQVIHMVEHMPGVTLYDNEVHIRGGRADDTQFIIDGMTMNDPLAGGGYGYQIDPSLINEIEVMTGGFSAEYGQAVSGVVNVSTKEGTDIFSGKASLRRDYLIQPVPKDDVIGWRDLTVFSEPQNVDIVRLALSGPDPITGLLEAVGLRIPGKRYLLVSGAMDIRDGYLPIYSRQEPLQSPIYTDSFWAPRERNEWNGLLKWTWHATSRHKLNITASRQVGISQGFHLPGEGYPRPFMEGNPDSLNGLDKYLTFTTENILTQLYYRQILSENNWFEVTFGRNFTRLHANLNGEDGNVADELNRFEGYELFNPDGLPPRADGQAFGSADRWHDHYADNYTFRTAYSFMTDTRNHFKTGLEMSFTEMQLIDLQSQLQNPPPGKLGITEDIFQAHPVIGSAYLQDTIHYRGLIVNVGLRGDFWAPGREVELVMNNSEDYLFILPDMVEEFNANTFDAFGRRWKARLSPRLGFSFPVTNKDKFFFNYGHFSQWPRFAYVYPQLQAQTATKIQLLGNPNLDPKITIEYETGLQHEFSGLWSAGVTFFYRDIYGYAKSVRLEAVDIGADETPDPDDTGTVTINPVRYFNGDSARSLGIELSLIKRTTRWLSGSANLELQHSTGTNSRADEAYLQAIYDEAYTPTASIGGLTRTPLLWDKPWAVSVNLDFSVFESDRPRLLGIRLPPNWSLNILARAEAGQRYTPRTWLGGGAFIYSDFNSDTGPYRSSINLRFNKYWRFGRNGKLTFSLEARNLLNHVNYRRINPWTGTGYQVGDYNPSWSQRWGDGPEELASTDSADYAKGVVDPSYIENPRLLMWGLEYSW